MIATPLILLYVQVGKAQKTSPYLCLPQQKISGRIPKKIAIATLLNCQKRQSQSASVALSTAASQSNSHFYEHALWDAAVASY
jgi:hypothetical protein